MKRWLPWLVLAGCARPPASEPPHRHELAAGIPVVGAPTPEPIARPAVELPYARTALPNAPRTVASAVDGTIAEIAAPTDGSYAVTLDTSGGVLLWPTLDGKHEPVVVATRVGLHVATLRDGDAIAIAVLDRIGQLELVRVADDGSAISNDDLASPRPIVQIIATSGHLLALRDDQVVAAIDPKGALVAELEAPPGERLARLVAHGDHVVGISAAPRGKHTARVLELGATLAWAAPTKRFQCDDDDLVLAADGKRLVGTTGNHAHVVQIAVANGNVEQLDYEVRDNPQTEFVLGVSDHHSVLFMDDGTAYERSDNTATAEVAGDGYAAGMVFTPERAIGGLDLAYLVVIERGHAKYLGYHSGTLADVIATSDGNWLASDGAGLFRLDPALRFTKAVETPFSRPERWQGATALLDERHAVIVDDSSYFVYQLGAKSGDLIASESYGRIDFMHSTGLALLPGKTNPTLARWNAKQGKFDVVYELPGGTYSGFVRLYDPAATTGISAMWVDNDDPNSGVPGKQKVTFHEVRGTGTNFHVRDRSQLVDNADLFDGRSGPMLDSMLPAAAVRATSADGTLIAELVNDRITMFDRDGNVRWAHTAQGARGLAWNSSDVLIAFGSGIAHVDLETGDFSDQRCGWDFGLWTKPPDTQSGSRMCMLP